MSLPGGAIRGWDRRNAYYFQMVQALAAHYDFEIDTPFEQLPVVIAERVLAPYRRQEVGRDQARPLMEELIEGVLTIGSGLAPDHRPRLVVSNRPAVPAAASSPGP